jgi:hypothetical protein
VSSSSKGKEIIEKFGLTPQFIPPVGTLVFRGLKAPLLGSVFDSHSAKIP